MLCQQLSLVWILYAAVLLSVTAVPPPPVQNKTTIILYTDTKTWNEAKLVCESLGQKLLDIVYYSLYITVGSMALVSPWVDLPVGNGPPKWISLHRRVTPLGDEFYSIGCQSLAEFNVRYWGGLTPYVPDGNPDTFCVYHETIVEPVEGGGFSSKADYTMGNCSEKHMFYCQKEQGPCPFETLTDRHGNTTTDFTANDIYLTYTSDDACKERCFQESSLIESSNDVTEECWGFTTTATQCIIHIVVKPTFFDTGNHYSAAGSKLFMKRCFYIDIDNTVFDVGQHDSFYPDSTCGTPILENSTVSTSNVFVYHGTSTWNEGLQTCRDDGQQLLDIKSEEMYTAIQSLITKHPLLATTGNIWLGYHEPDPEHYTNIRVWSDCTVSAVSSNWDASFPPSTDVTDVNLCVVMNTANLKWRTVQCNESHSLVCVQETIPGAANAQYDSGTAFTVGAGLSLGPYTYNYSACSVACSNWAYQGQDCRAFAHRFSLIDGDVCHLYFADNFTYYDTNVQISVEAFTFYRKLLWTDQAVTVESTVSDKSIFPYSCCDLSTIDIRSECPADKVPSLDTNIPTTKKVIFVLHTVPQTWNEASTVCQNSGGKLVRINGVAKRKVLDAQWDTWQAEGHVNALSLVWSGLVLADQEDTCSYRWPNVCTTPDWVVFQTGTSSPDTSRLCGAVNNNLNHVMRQCNESLKYICELETNDPCAVDETLPDTNCFLEAPGEYTLGTTGTCNDLCLTATKLGKECWTTIDIDVSTCAVLFYINPFHCRTNKATMAGRLARIKNCYSAEVETGVAAVTTDTSYLPITDCYQPFAYPYQKDVGRCPQTTTTSTTTSPTTTISTLASTTTTTTTTTSTSTTSTIPTTTTTTTPAATTTTTTSATTTTTSTPASTTIPETTSTTEPTSAATTTTPSTTTEPATETSTSTTATSTEATTTTVSTAITTTMRTSTTTAPTIGSSAGLTTTTINTSPAFETSFSSFSFTSEATTSFTESPSPERRSVPTNVQTVVPIALAASIVVPIQSLPQAVHSENLTDPIFLWPCTCNTDSDNKMTVEEWTEWLIQTQSIVKNKTSKYQRRLKSAEDQRTSTVSIGIVAAATLTSFAVLILILDAPTMIHNIAHIHAALKAKNYTPK